MKTLIENTILIITVIILSTFMITSIEDKNKHKDWHDEIASEQKWEAQQRIERLTKGGI